MSFTYVVTWQDKASRNIWCTSGAWPFEKMAEAKAKEKGKTIEKPPTVAEDKDDEEPEGFDSVNLKEEDKVQPIKFQTESFFSLARRKCKHFFTNITLEPVMLFYGIVTWVTKDQFWLVFYQPIICRSIDRVASSQLLFDKTCYNDFNFSEEICDDLQQHKENETSVGVGRVKKYKAHL